MKTITFEANRVSIDPHSSKLSIDADMEEVQVEAFLDEIDEGFIVEYLSGKGYEINK